MRWLLLFAVSAASMFAELQPPNDAGISMGHVQITVRDPVAQSKLWTDVFGPQIGKAGPFQLLKLPGIDIIVNQAESNAGGSDGSAVNHIGIAVKDYGAIKAKLAKAKVKMKELTHNQEMVATFPEGVRVEIIADKNLATPVAFHHIQMSAVDQEAARTWYVKHFGAMPTSHGTEPAATLPGGQIEFMKASMPPAPTKGRALDHIGFEVKNLEAFCKALKEDGVKFDLDYVDLPRYGLKAAFLTDPSGAYIELTEGLAGK